MQFKHLFVILAALSLTLVGCNDKPVEQLPKADVMLTAGTVTEDSITVTLSSINATETAWILLDDALLNVNADYVITQGNIVASNATHTITIDKLESATAYKIVAVARNASSTAQKSIKLTTKEFTPHIEQLAITMTAAERLATEDMNCYSLKFTDEKKQYELGVVMYGAPLGGEYTLAQSAENGTISMADSYLKGADKSYTFDEGNITVSTEDDKSYTFAMTFKSGNTEIEVNYNGAVENIVLVEELSLSFDAASRNTSAEQNEGDYYITLQNNTEAYTLNMLFNGDAEKELPIGTYTVGGSTNSVGIGYLTADSEEIFEAEEGTVVVERSGDEYTFAIEFSCYNLIVEGSYKGVVENMSVTPELKNVVFATASSVHGGADHSVTFKTADESIVLKADIYTYDPALGYLVSGEYVVINSGYSFSAGEIDYYYSSINMDGSQSNLHSGTIDVTLNDDLTYDIEIDVTDNTGRSINGTFNGAIENMSFERGYKFVSAMLNLNNSDTSNGKYNLTFKTTGSESADYLTMSFYAEQGGSYLPAGVYTISDEKMANCIDTNSIVLTTFSYGTPVIDRGEVEVIINEDGTYSFRFDMKQAESHISWICSYDGAVANMDTTTTESTTLNFISANGYYSDDSGETNIYLVADNGKQIKLGIIDLSWQTSTITSGTYTVSSSWSTGVIYSGWYGTDWNDGVGFASGTADIKNNGNGTYTINVNITLTNDESYNGVYNGAIDGMR